jgi:hypothetical protein
MRAYLDLMFNNIFRAAVTAAVIIFALYHYPTVTEIMIILPGIIGFVIGLVYGYLAQLRFAPGNSATPHQRIVALIGWFAFAVLLGLGGYLFFSIPKSTLHPQSVLNIRSLTFALIVPLAHALLGVIYNILSTRTVAGPRRAKELEYINPESNGEVVHNGNVLEK